LSPPSFELDLELVLLGHRRLPDRLKARFVAVSLDGEGSLWNGERQEVSA